MDWFGVSILATVIIPIVMATWSLIINPVEKRLKREEEARQKK